MPAPAVLIQLWLKRYGWRILKVLVRLFGLEEVLRFVWGWLQKVTGSHPDRRRALRKAEEIDGLLGSALLEDGAHWVVFKDDQPVAAYPAYEGDLDEGLRNYRRELLREPGELPSRRAQSWFRDRVTRGLRRDREDEEAPEARSPSGGAEDFKRVVDDLEPLLKRLTESPRTTLADHSSIPKRPGVYLLSEGPSPIYVGQTRNLHLRLRQLGSLSSNESSAPLAFNIALREAEKDPSVDTSGTRKELTARPEFDALLRAARKRVSDMNAQVIELDDPVTRTLFEVYAARILGTDEFSSSQPH